MITRFKKDMVRRRAETIHYFFRAVGMHIRKRRKELNLTQETLAKGICSNTYVSKMETNSIAVNEDSLHLIMERMDLEYALEMNVDEQLSLFDRALDAYLEGDYDGLEKVHHEVRNVEFAVLTDLCRMIRDVVRGDEREIVRTTDNLSRYLESMDHYAFGVFMFYGAAGMLAVGRPADAIDVLEELEHTEYAYLKLAPMVEYLKAIGYGRTGRLLQAADALRTAEAFFLRAMNFRRLGELAVLRLELMAMTGADMPKPQNETLLAVLDGEFRDRYHHARVLGGIDAKTEARCVDAASRHRRPALFAAGKQCFERGDRDGYRDMLDLLQKEKSPADKLDYARWLELVGAGDDVAEKDFLIAEVLPHAEGRTDLSMMRQTHERIVHILKARRRYKDALQYDMKLKRFERRIAKVSWEDEADETAEDEGSGLE